MNEIRFTMVARTIKLKPMFNVLFFANFFLSKIRQAIDALFRRSSTMLDSLPSRFDFTSVASAPTTPTCPNTPGAAGNPFASKKVNPSPPAPPLFSV